MCFLQIFYLTYVPIRIFKPFFYIVTLLHKTLTVMYFELDVLFFFIVEES